MNKEIKTNEKGITLIALVITIIVLLILAGVSIAMLTGENGILTKATEAKSKTEQAEKDEQVKLAVAAARDNSGNFSADLLITELAKYGLTVTKDADGNVIVETGNKKYTINSEGEILEENKVTTGGTTTPEEPVNPNTQPATTIAEAQLNSMLTKTVNSTITDSYGNSITVPAGFKITSDATNVTQGIVIEDESENQFVWVPVGKIYTDTEKTESKAKTIELKRYVFDEDGNIDETLSKTLPGDQLKTSSTDEYYCTEGLSTDTTENTHAKDINAFRTSANSNHGYYIGRYEARTATARSAETDALSSVTSKGTDYVYNYVTQSQAAELAQNMYQNATTYTSDLVNSYAWDTAIVFEQKFDDRTNTNTPYSRKTSLNTSLETKGTNGTNTEDKICNIYDMASNIYEWITETYSDSSRPCVGRGGNCNYSDGFTSIHGYDSTTTSYFDRGFRSLLYL